MCPMHLCDVYPAMTISELPALNASLNAFSTVFIAAGWYFIRRGFWRQHIACMITAIISSAAFLTSYLIYQRTPARCASPRRESCGRFISRFCITHVLLAFTVLPLVIMTVVPALRRRWDKHRRMGRWTMPIWLYVSVTGVIVYFMLYQWFRPAGILAVRSRRRSGTASLALAAFDV